MNAIIDTHAVIWFITDDKKLSKKARSFIKNIDNRCFVSIASLWEMGVKYSFGKLELKTDLANIINIIESGGFTYLPISKEEILINSELEFYHRDPFDRLIIAQAIKEEIPVITKDQYFNEYKIKTIW